MTTFALSIVPWWCVEARVEETIDECEQRYGKPLVAYPDGMRMYKKGGVLLGVWFRSGVAWQIIYKKDDHSRLTKSEKDAILSVYGNWGRPTLNAKGLRTWHLSKRGLVAKEDFAGTLYVANAAEARRQDADDRQRLQEDL